MRFVRGRATNGLFWRALGGSGGEACTAGDKPRGRSKAEDGGRALFCFAMQSGPDQARGGKEWRTAVAPHPRFSWPSRHTSKGRSCGSSECLRKDGMTSAKTDALVRGPGYAAEKPKETELSGPVLTRQMRPKPLAKSGRSTARPSDRRSKSFPDGTSSLAAMPREMAMDRQARALHQDPARSLSQAM